MRGDTHQKEDADCSKDGFHRLICLSSKRESAGLIQIDSVRHTEVTCSPSVPENAQVNPDDDGHQ